MDLSEDKFKQEVNNLVSSLRKFLPKKKDLLFIEQKRVKLTRLGDFHAEAKNSFPKCFVGAKLVVLREIMDKVKLVQQYNYGKSKESYKCYSTLLHKELEPKSVDEGLLVDSSGSATAVYHETIQGAYDMRLISKIKDLISSETEVVFEKESDKSIGSISCSVRDVDPSTLRLVAQWMYKVMPELSFGTEFGFKPLSFPLSSEFSISSRYERGTFTLTTTVSKAGLQMCMFKQFADDLRLAMIVAEGSSRARSTTFSLALHKNYPGSELKIFVDSQRCGGFTFQKDVLFYEPHNEIRILRLMGSTLIDRQRRVRFGIGINMDF